MAQSQKTSGDLRPVNGYELTDLNAVERAFGYLLKDYNNGNMTRHDTGTGAFVTLTFRDRHSEHFEAIRDSPFLMIRDVYARIDGRQVIEVTEQ